MFRKGFSNQENEIIATDLIVEGKLPKWLNGNLYRNGPGKFDYPDTKLIHWFDGPAMVSQFSFANGGMTYQNKFVRTDIYQDSARLGKMSAIEFGTDPRSMITRLGDLFKGALPISDNVNVNFLKIQDKLLAITGGAAHYQLDSRTIDTIGAHSFADPEPLDMTGQTPHPSLDHNTGDIYNIGFNFIKNQYIFFKIPKGTNERHLIKRMSVPKLSDIHSFSTTENFIIFIEEPWFLNKAKMLRGKSYLESLEWQPKTGTNFIIVDKHSGEVQRVHYDEAIHFGHTANAFEKKDKIIIDMPYFNRSNINDMRVEAILTKGQVLDGYQSFSRFTIDREHESVSRETLSEHFIELETINYKHCNEQDYQFVYGPSQGKEARFFDRLLKIDIVAKTEKIWQEENCFPGEMVFIPAPDYKTEDDGVLLSVILDGVAGTSFMLVLDGQSFTELARIRLPQHIPFGFHGQFYASA